VTITITLTAVKANLSYEQKFSQLQQLHVYPWFYPNLKAGALLFNTEVFSSKPWKKFGADSSCRFREKRKKTHL